MINSKLALKATEAFESKNSSNITQDSNTCCISLIGAKPRTTFKYQGYQMPVYRWVMIAIDGYLESDQMVLHSCDNACCFNPEHLRVGSHVDNNKDRAHR
ncbi:MAG: hypothetical protein ACI9YH_001760 [Colwellia sp.]|jgi:hypothetical protein